MNPEARVAAHDVASSPMGGVNSVDSSLSARFAGRCIDRLALQARLEARPQEVRARPTLPPIALNTGAVVAAVAQLLLPDASACFAGRIEAGAQGSVRRVLVPLSGDRRLAVDVVPQVVRFHPADLQRLLFELVDNGQRHSPPGCTVRVRGAPGVGGYQISVTNPGERLPRSALNMVRAHGRAEAREPLERLQLGLSMAAMLADLNDARLEVVRGAGRPNTLRIVALTVAP